MTTPGRDPLLDMLAALPATTPTVEATERLRARCHAALGQSKAAPSPIPSVLNAVLTTACAVYLAAAIYQAMSLIEVTGIWH